MGGRLRGCRCGPVPVGPDDGFYIFSFNAMLFQDFPYALLDSDFPVAVSHALADSRCKVLIILSHAEVEQVACGLRGG
jgi:hypothetical protein